ncbi:Nonribosomal peptide synthetase, partial [Lachnellula suecica]
SVVPEVIVPLVFEKSKWAIVGLLGILKAGGTFLLLDPSQPIARLESIVQQTGATFALSSKTCIGTSKALVENAFIVDSETIPKLGSSQHCSSARSNTAAYLIFTSGSTGSPKGVIIENSQLSTTATNVGRHLGYDKHPRVFQFASYAFDACITDIFATLVYGGVLCIPSEWERNNAIIDAMRRMGVTNAKFTPSLASNLDFADVPMLDTLVLGGESAPSSLIEKWASKLRVILVYGPTECCVICFISDTSQHKPTPGEIGRPLSVAAWIVKQDDYNELANIGDIGELLVAGPVLGRGYLNDLDKTNRHFINHPAWMPLTDGPIVQTHHRMYRTGDLARYLENGSICYAGRIDNQVKIRGQRLELEEVENKLRDCLIDLNVATQQVVVEAVVLSGLKSKQLVAFLCLRTPESHGFLDWETESPEGPAIRTSTTEQERFSAMVLNIESTMRTLLPNFAIPSIWVPLLSVPFAVSRKVDRKRLRSVITPLSTKQLIAFVKPNPDISPNKKRTQLTKSESKLQILWADAFGVETSSIDTWDNFFSLGGDSVLAIKIIAAARAGGLDLSLDIVFEHPILCEMAGKTKDIVLQEELSAEIPPFALLDQRDSDRFCEEAGREFSIHKNKILDAYPLSPMQEGLLASSIKDPGTYILQFVYRMPESVDLSKLKAAWESVAKRTQVLRTRFYDNNSDLVQVVIDQPLPWKVVDGDLAKFLVAEKARRTIVGAVMSRHAVVRQSKPHQYFLVWTIHHALVDGWSESDIINSVELEYSGNTWNSKIPKFNSFIKHIGQQDKESAQDFWRKQLSGAPTTVFPPLPDPSYIPKVQRANRILHHLDSHEEAEVECKIPLFKRGSATAATMIQAAWFLLIGMYSNTSDVVTGVTLNGRTAQIPGIDRIPGPTVTTVPFRAQFTPDQKVADFLHNVQRQNLSILPFSQFGLQNIRGLSEDAVFACKFRSLLVVQSANRPLGFSKLLEGRSYSFPVMDFVIVMECELHKESIDFRATFDHQILSEKQVRRMIRQMESILHGISTSNSLTTVSDLQKISEADVLEIFEWNSNAPKAVNYCVHELIQQRARNRRQASAVCAWDGNLSYEMLERYASRLAGYLQRHYHVGPESLVAVCFEGSLWAVVSLLAVLKAGGVCFPVDYKESNASLEQVMGSLGGSFASIVLASSTTAKRLRKLGVKILAVNQAAIDGIQETGAVNTKVSPANAAFVVFGAGSSRNPRGVIIEHRAFCLSALGSGSFLQRNEQSRVLQITTSATNLSIREVFLTLITGGTICLPSENQLDNLDGTIDSFKPNHLTLTPTVAGYLRPEDISSVKVLTVSGEAMTKGLIERWKDHVTFNNVYGSPECSMYSIGQAGIERKEDYNNIGFGIGTLTWIVDPQDSNSLTPIGGAGEILVESPSLARGYLGDDSLTRSAFIENPIWSRSGGSKVERRFYKTGDLASYNFDGSINFLGRVNKVHLNGHHIEVAHVEQQLRDNLPSSAQLAVTVVCPNGGDEVLAAFVVLDSDKDWKSSETKIEEAPQVLVLLQGVMEGLETKLRSLLPRYMIPSVYLPIQRLPLSKFGKVDREALQTFASQLSAEEISSLRANKPILKSSKSPSTRTEKRIQNLWKTLLRCDEIGIDDNFFQLGGGSVLAMRLVSMARREGLTMTVNSIFKASTLKDLALRTQENVSVTDLAPFALLHDQDLAKICKQAAAQCGISRDDMEDIYPCSVMQSHYITGYPEEKRNLSDPWKWQSQMVYSIPPSVDLDRFRDVWNSAIRRYPTLRTRIINTSSGILQVVVKEFEPWKWKSADDLEQYLEEDRSDHMTFGHRLLRLAIVEPRHTDQRYFVFTIHHIVYDAFARSMLFKEVDTAYSNGFTDTPLPKMNQFIKYVTEADKDAATDFWTTHLNGVVTKPLLASTEKHTLLKHTEKSMAMDIPVLHVPEITLPKMIEVAGGLAIARRLGSSDVIFYSDRSGRNIPVPGIEDLVGPTTLFLPVRIHYDPQQKVLDLLRESQKFEIDMMPHEHLGWLELREMDHLKTALQHSVEINVNPRGLVSLGGNLGLEFERSFESFDDPFGIHCFLHNGKMEWCISYDDRYISHEVVDTLLKEIIHVFDQLVGAYTRPDLTVGGIFYSVPKDTNDI